MPGFPQFAPIQHHLDGEKPEPGRLPLFFRVLRPFAKVSRWKSPVSSSGTRSCRPRRWAPLDVADGGRRDVLIGQISMDNPRFFRWARMTAPNSFPSIPNVLSIFHPSSAVKEHGIFLPLNRNSRSSRLLLFIHHDPSQK